MSPSENHVPSRSSVFPLKCPPVHFQKHLKSVRSFLLYGWYHSPSAALAPEEIICAPPARSAGFLPGSRKYMGIRRKGNSSASGSDNHNNDIEGFHPCEEIRSHHNEDSESISHRNGRTQIQTTHDGSRTTWSAVFFLACHPWPTEVSG